MTHDNGHRPIQEKLVGRGLTPGEHLLDAGYPSVENVTRAGRWSWASS